MNGKYFRNPDLELYNSDVTKIMTEIRFDNVTLKDTGTAARTNDHIGLREKMRSKLCTYNRPK